MYENAAVAHENGPGIDDHAFTLALPFPPSTNTAYADYRGRRLLTEHGRAYKRAVWACWVQQRPCMPFPLTGRLAVTLVFHRHNKVTYDIENFSKLLVDALQECGVMVDDSQIDYMVKRRGEVIASPRGLVHVTIQEIKE